MSDYRMDDNGDLDISNDTLHAVTGREAIAQEVRIALRFFLGEWFLDLDEGVPYFTDVFGKRKDVGLVRDLFRRRILSVPGVLNVPQLSLEFTPSERRAVLSFTAATVEDAPGEPPLQFVEVLS